MFLFWLYFWLYFWSSWVRSRTWFNCYIYVWLWFSFLLGNWFSLIRVLCFPALNQHIAIIFSWFFIVFFLLGRYPWFFCWFLSPFICRLVWVSCFRFNFFFFFLLCFECLCTDYNLRLYYFCLVLVYQLLFGLSSILKRRRFQLFISYQSGVIFNLFLLLFCLWNYRASTMTINWLLLLNFTFRYFMIFLQLSFSCF